MALARDLSELPRAEARQQSDGWAPDAEPRFARVLIDKWADANAERNANYKRRTRFHLSSAGKCARALAFDALDLPASDPMDLSGIWNTTLGTLLHEAWQEALALTYPDAEIEVRSVVLNGDGSGYCDAKVTLPDGRVIVIELKSIGGYGFKSATGTIRKSTPAEGPKFEHVLQAAINGKHLGADEVVVAYLAKECLSLSVAKTNGIDELGRFTAEWTLTAEQFLPLAEEEEARVRGILDLLDEGTLPARKIPAPDVPKGAEIVDPSRGRWEVRKDGQIADTGSYWACDYCSHQTRCATTPSGRCSTDVLVDLGGAA